MLGRVRYRRLLDVDRIRPRCALLKILAAHAPSLPAKAVSFSEVDCTANRVDSGVVQPTVDIQVSEVPCTTLHFVRRRLHKTASPVPCQYGDP